MNEALEKLNAALREAIAAAGDDKAARKAVLQQFSDGLAAEARQFVTDIGFAASHNEGKAKIAALNADVEDLKAKLADAERRAGATDDKSADYERRLADKQAEIEGLKAAHATERRNGLVATSRGTLRAALSKLLDPVAVEAALARLGDGRMKATDDGVTYYREDGMTPVTAKSGETVEQTVASELAEGFDPRYQLASTGNTGLGFNHTGQPTLVTDQSIRDQARNAVGGSYDF